MLGGSPLIEGILKNFVSLFVECLLTKTIVVHLCAVGIFWIMDVEWRRIFRVPMSQRDKIRQGGVLFRHDFERNVRVRVLENLKFLVLFLKVGNHLFQDKDLFTILCKWFCHTWICDLPASD